MGLPPLGRRALAKQRFQCIWALTRQVPLDLDIEAIAKGSGSSPDKIALALLMPLFGPLTPGLVEHVKDEAWQQDLRSIGANAPAAEGEAGLDEMNFEKNWNQKEYPQLDPAMKGLICQMIKLDPWKRLTIKKVLEDACWDDIRG